LDVHEYHGTFQGGPANFKMTSVIGHVLSLDFTAAYNNWAKTDPMTLFDAETVKSESNPKVCQVRVQP
jgi:DNA topoisomerase-3